MAQRPAVYFWYGATSFVTLVLLLVRIPLGTFNQQTALDAFAHVVLPATVAPVLYGLLRERVSRSAAVPSFTWLVPIVAGGSAGELLWELFEFAVDRSFGTAWQVSGTDTVIDIASAVIGTLVGGWLFVRLQRRRP